MAGTIHIENIATRSRWPYFVLLAFDIVVTGTVLILLITEPQPLPPATVAAFIALISIGTAWACLFLWVLFRHRVMFPIHRIIAAAIALTASSLFSIFGVTIALVRDERAVAIGVGLSGLAMISLSLIAFRSAKRRRVLLLDRRAELESQYPDSRTVNEKHR